MRKPTKAKRVIEDYECAVCGEPGCYGLGPPMTEFQRWYCSYHWGRLPETQAMYADRLLLAAGVDSDDQQRGI